MLFLCFGVGFAVFGFGLEWPMRRLADELARRLPPGLELAALYGPTGNVAIRSTRGQAGTATRTQVRNALAFTERPWAVVEVPRVRAALAELEVWSVRGEKESERPTPGLAFLVSGTPQGSVSHTWRANLRRVARGIVAVQKLDVILPDGRLHPRDRRGGWGAVSDDIGRQVGGIWTARSRQTIRGLLSRA